ncbi:hypothetical protein HRW23_10310 [Streptomyces lunaelactis]|nr:hypothetical protein [Streptomyces lunaelactis]
MNQNGGPSAQNGAAASVNGAAPPAPRTEEISETISEKIPVTDEPKD